MLDECDLVNRLLLVQIREGLAWMDLIVRGIVDARMFCTCSSDGARARVNYMHVKVADC